MSGYQALGVLSCIDAIEGSTSSSSLSSVDPAHADDPRTLGVVVATLTLNGYVPSSGSRTIQGRTAKALGRADLLARRGAYRRRHLTRPSRSPFRLTYVHEWASEDHGDQLQTTMQSTLQARQHPSRIQRRLALCDAFRRRGGFLIKSSAARMQRVSVERRSHGSQRPVDIGR
ncbi:hypothetical protein OH77DRAFT_1318323 [Trametes cingulata]|nr:hypothetical protein OH77DRAFT_1318323 [Trametes cingulata]